MTDGSQGNAPASEPASNPPASLHDPRLDKEFEPKASSSKARYCWLKIAAPTLTKSDPRPPNAVARSAIALESIDMSAGAGRDLDVFYAVPGWWNDSAVLGQIEYGPAFKNASTAMEWYLNSGEAVIWREGAQAVTLLAFAELKGFSGVIDKNGHMAAKAPTCRAGGFADWSPEYLALIDATPKPEEALFDDAAIDKLLDSDFARLPVDPTGECDEIAGLVTSKRRERRAEIDREKHFWAEVGKRMAEIAGIDLSVFNPSWKLLQLWLMNTVEPAVYRLKCSYNRRRPRDVCHAKAQPMFERPDLSYPGHASFPGGHATMAYVLADLLGNRFQAKKADLRTYANRVIENREVAGLHFRSDSDAGKKLGEAMAAMIITPDTSSPAQIKQNCQNLIALVNRL